MSAVGRNPKAALDLAYADGGMTSEEYAQRLQQIYEADEQHKRALQLADTTRRYAGEDRDAQWAHDDKRAEAEWQREDRRNQLNANIELLKVFAANGHLDTYNADIEDLIKRIRGDGAGPQVQAREQHAELSGGQAAESRGAEGDNDD
jgi:ferric-dicitrate binding protein FerR (iron transport regulator)